MCDSSDELRIYLLYIMSGYEAYEKLLARLGKHPAGTSCLYVKRLADVDMEVPGRLVKRSVDHMAESNRLRVDQ